MDAEGQVEIGRLLSAANPGIGHQVFDVLAMARQQREELQTVDLTDLITASLKQRAMGLFSELVWRVSALPART